MNTNQILVQAAAFKTKFNSDKHKLHLKSLSNDATNGKNPSRKFYEPIPSLGPYVKNINSVILKKEKYNYTYKLFYL